MDFAHELCVELARDGGFQRRTRGDAESQRRRQGIDRAQGSKHGWDKRERGGAGLNEGFLNCAGEGVVSDNEGNAVAEEGSDEIAKAVGVGERDDSKIKIIRAEPHHGADIVAVGENLLGGECNGSGKRGRA